MIPATEAIIISGLRKEAERLRKHATSIEFDAQDLLYQAREIESQYEYQGPCVGCEKHKNRTCHLAGTCGATDQCQKARELAGMV